MTGNSGPIERATLHTQPSTLNPVCSLRAEAAAVLHCEHLGGVGAVGFRDDEWRFLFDWAGPIQARTVEREERGAIAAGADIADGDDPESGGVDQIDTARF